MTGLLRYTVTAKKYLFNDEAFVKNSNGIIAFDLPLTGETGDDLVGEDDKAHTNTARALWWLGKTLVGEWAKYIVLVADWLKEEKAADGIQFLGYREAALAGLFAEQ
ncbi:MAG: hypothetical protein O3A82_17155 [Verrucomicrobia bacterium]|nr:hypothetical protein [Verrucomicrobiota bacterium]MDA0725046.1 hypothetical protein [Verrucomicrobiota bacterium]MDA1048640.1 hypothetical protein [Verrucomicrobiota bacterium]